MLWFLGKNENEVKLIEENNNLRKKNLELENDIKLLEKK